MELSRETLAVQRDHLSLLPETHAVEGEPGSFKLSSVL